MYQEWLLLLRCPSSDERSKQGKKTARCPLGHMVEGDTGGCESPSEGLGWLEKALWGGAWEF